MFSRNRNKAGSEFSDPISVETRSELQARLDHINELLELANEALGRSVTQKFSGQKHDGQHNIDVDAISMRIQQLETEKRALLARLDRINAGLASTALRSSFES